MNISVYIMQIKQVLSDSVVSELITYARERRFQHMTTVSDSNTYTLIGQNIHKGLQNNRIGNGDIILNGNNLSVDEGSVISVLADISIETDAIIAVGSGTITDIVRLVSHRLKKDFICVPTAPSTIGYTSIVTPLTLKGLKRSISCHPPSLIIVSPTILTTAPYSMIASGFGEIIGKIISVADWELSNLLMDVPFERKIADEILSACLQTMESAAGIARREREAITTLFTALATAGEAMSRFGSSRPVSGSEHHISHFLEMRRLAINGPPLLHGVKVALGAIISAEWYKTMRSLQKVSISKLPVKVPEFESDAADLRRLLGEPGHIILDSHTYLSTLDLQKAEKIKGRLIEHWDEIQSIAERVPVPQELRNLMKKVGGPESPADIGISHEEITDAARLSHYVRNRFTIKTLLFTLGLPSKFE